MIYNSVPAFRKGNEEKLAKEMADSESSEVTAHKASNLLQNNNVHGNFLFEKVC